MGESQIRVQRFQRIRRKSLNTKDGTTVGADRRKISLSSVNMFYPPVPSQEVNFTRDHSISDQDELPLQQSPSRTTIFLEHDSPLPEVSLNPRFPTAVSKGSKQWAHLDCLPESVLQCVLQHLAILHLGRQSMSCRTCYMRDLVALQLTSKRWQRRARKCLYESIAIIGDDSSVQLQRYEIPIGSRLKLLRRTLREHDDLALLVKKLHVHDLDIPIFQPDGHPCATFAQYRDLIASVVMACPNLERLTGFCCWYNHEYDRLTHALSTRSKLRSHVLIVSENDEVTARSQVQLPPGLLSSVQVDQFVHNNRWSKLEDFMICSPGKSGIVEHELFLRVLRDLPSLQRLCISSFDADDFNDKTLVGLPPLKSFRLEECFGVSDGGLIRWAGMPTSRSLEDLVLIHQNLQWLLTISKLLASLSSLVKFTLTQSDNSPQLPTETMVFQPVLASSSLRHLHWDIDNSQHTKIDRALSANAHLALSVSYGGFPALCTLRAPRDDSPTGALQAVCRPASAGRILYPGDQWVMPSAAPPDVVGAMNSALTRGNSLRAARLRAQNYMEKQRKLAKEGLDVVITEHPDTEYDEDSCSSSSYSYSEASTEDTDPRDLLSPQEFKPSELGPSFRSELSPLDASTSGSITGQFSQTAGEFQYRQNSSLRSQSSAHRASADTSVSSRFSKTSATSNRVSPRFHLAPDVDGYESNGGLVGWGDLLRVQEKMKLRGVTRKPPTMEGCMGMWNQGGGKPVEQWWHMPRPRCHLDTIIETEHFF